MTPHRRSRTAVWLVVASGALSTAACIGGISRTVTGQIRDDGITLDADRAGSGVKLQLQNVDAESCDIVVVLTSLPADALPVSNGHVVIDESGVGPVRSFAGPAGRLAQVGPDAGFSYELALGGAPKTDERVVLCNGSGEYAAGRYAVLRFDR